MFVEWKKTDYFARLWNGVQKGAGEEQDRNEFGART
jgi:hypothetical protein